MTFISSEAPICTGVSPPVNEPPVHTLTHSLLMSCDSAHIHLGPTVLVHVTDHKQNMHSSTGDTPQDTQLPQKHQKTGVWEAPAAPVCVMLMAVCVCTNVCVKLLGKEKMPAGHVISLTLARPR